MKHDRTGCSVLGAGLLLALCLRSLAARTIEDLLSSQEVHEDAAHTEFVKWCRATQSTLTDRITFQKEEIAELASAIQSYGETVGELRNATKKVGGQPLDVLTQDQRLKLIQTESEHWRSVHTKTAAEKLLKADMELLAAIDDSLHWEEQALSKHQGQRQQLIALVREHHIQGSIEPKPSLDTLFTPAPSASSEAEGDTLMPPVSLPKFPPASPRALPQAEVKRHVQPASPLRPRTSVVRANSEAVVELPPAAAPIFGISQLPALQLVQADDSKKQSPLFSALQGASHPVPPSTPTPQSQQQSASSLLTPMLSQDKALETPAPALSPLLSLAGMSTQASALPDLSSQLATTLAPADVPPMVTSPEDAEPSIKQAPPAAPATASKAAASKVASVSEPSATLAPSAAAAVDVSAQVVTTPESLNSKVAVPESAEASIKVDSTAGSSPSTAKSPPETDSLASTVEEALPLPSPVLAQPMPKSTPPKKAAPTEESLSRSPAAPSKADVSKDPEEALMAIMTGSSSQAAASDEEDSVVEAPTTPPSKLKAAPKKATTAFLGVKSESTVQKVSSPATPKDPEDALMEVMMQSGDNTDASTVVITPPLAKAASQPKTVKHSPSVLAQTDQAVHVAPVGLQKSQPIKPHSNKQQAADSEKGVMQSFIQEVSNLAQGEPSDSSADPAASFQEEQESQESEAHMMKSFVQEVSRLAQGEAAEEKPTVAPTTESGLALSSDLESLMGMAPASFLQVAQQDRHIHEMSRSELAAASLIKDLESSAVSQRLARTVSQSSIESNVQMLTALNEQLQARQFQWACAKGPAAAHSMIVLQLAETGTALLIGERQTLASLSAELRSVQEESANTRAEFIALLEQTLGRGYKAAEADLKDVPLEQIRQESSAGASAFVALQNALGADAVAAEQLGSKFVNQGSDYVRLGDELLKTSSAKDAELKKAKRVLEDARARAANSRKQVSKETGCADAARTSGLIAAVYKALHVLSD